jgi:trypsin
LAPLLIAGAALLAGSPAGVAATKIVGGSPIRIQSAPWTVFIRQTVSGGSLVCTGSIVDALHVVTAGHCVYDNTGALASITSIAVRAGISNYNTPQPGDAEQDRGVSSLRVHPGYSGPGSVKPDDIAVLALSAPLDLSGPTVQAVALPAANAPFPAGAAVAIAGYGRETSSSPPDGSLNSLTAAVDQQGSCGGDANAVVPDADAVALCAIPSAGTACTGDSGAGLVTTTGTPTLVGVVSAGPTGCGGGNAVILTYVGAPEILQFVQGNDQPPVAPRKTPATFVNLSWRGPLRVGNTLTCASGGWDGSPTLGFAFVSAKDKTLLQSGPNATYALQPAAVGDTVFCTALAANAGGTAVLSTTTTPAVQPAPALAINPVAPVAAVRGRTVSVRIILEAAAGLSGKFGVCITPLLQVAGRACASQTVAPGSLGAFPFTVRLRIKPTAPVGTSRLSITGVAGPSTGTRTALVRVSRV